MALQNAEDVIDFLSAGASAVAVGTANFVNPFICPNIIEELPAKLDELGIDHISELIGRSHRLMKTSPIIALDFESAEKTFEFLTCF